MCSTFSSSMFATTVVKVYYQLKFLSCLTLLPCHVFKPDNCKITAGLKQSLSDALVVFLIFFVLFISLRSRLDQVWIKKARVLQRTRIVTSFIAKGTIIVLQRTRTPLISIRLDRDLRRMKRRERTTRKSRGRRQVHSSYGHVSKLLIDDRGQFLAMQAPLFKF